MSERTAALAGGVALLERAIGFTVGSLRLVTTDRLGRPTPCAAWDLRALLTHMNDSLAALIEAAEVGAVDVVQPSSWARPVGCGDVVHGCWCGGDEITHGLIQPVCARARYLLGAWSWADGPDVVSIDDRDLSASIVASTGAIEIAVHGWDVAAACGQSREIPSVLAEELLELARVIIDDADRPQRFGRPVDVPAAASDSDRLVAFAGRHPS